MSKADKVQVSVILPCYNSIGKIEKCIASLERIAFEGYRYEVIFVDDCSTDNTYNFLLEECARRPNWKVERLAANSGSPSRPRNHGVQRATGDYVFFLDSDDEILPDTLKIHYEHALTTNSCVVRGYLLADDGKCRKAMNRLADWHASLSREERMRLVLKQQSTTVPSLIRRQLLSVSNIQWDENVWMGEDTLFLIDVLTAAKVLEYIDHPTFVYNKRPSSAPSSTQRYGERELSNHLYVWRSAQKKLASSSICYYSTRLQVGLQTALLAILWRNRGDITEATFNDFSSFVNDGWSVIGLFTYSERLRELLKFIRARDFGGFRDASRLRLLIAGYDLKFAKALMPLLQDRFDIRLDEWSGHARHNEAQSQVHLEWAEVIFCEWLLGNAVWYAQRKRRGQVLIVRAHRFELGREFGHLINADAVDAFLTVSVLFFERLIEQFKYDRRKVRLLPNLVRPELYTPPSHPDACYNLAIIGILPSRKGFAKALEILAELRKRDSRYVLHVLGQSPQEVDWITRDSKEVAYFAQCDKYIVENDLSKSVKHHGFVNVPEVLARERVGFVLSTSDNGIPPTGPESFHLAPAEGLASGAQAVILKWDGAEFIYPDALVFNSVEEAAKHIYQQRSPEEFKATAVPGQTFITERYGPSKIVSQLKSLIEEFA